MNRLLYRGATALLSPLAKPALAWRASKGKEDVARLPERLGYASLPRPSGPLVWLHGASVGEVSLALDLWGRFRGLRPDAEVLFTSGTRTSAELIDRRLPIRARHQYIPLDTPRAVGRFLDHWQPDLAVLMEGELWPNLLLEVADRGIKLALLNARMSEQSLRRWAQAGHLAKQLLDCFALTHAADMRTQAGLAALGGRLEPLPFNLKLAATPRVADLAALQSAEAALAGRPAWVAASTHPGEEEIVLAAHTCVCKSNPDALLIIAPRHPERGKAVSAEAGGAPRRSLDQPMAGPVYIADTIGELSLWYSLAGFAFIGGSLAPSGRGHNPCEALSFGCTIASGRGVTSFADVYAALERAGAVMWTDDAVQLADAVIEFWSHPQMDSASAGRALLQETQSLVDPLLAKLIGLRPSLLQQDHATP